MRTLYRLLRAGMHTALLFVLPWLTGALVGMVFDVQDRGWKRAAHGLEPVEAVPKPLALARVMARADGELITTGLRSRA